MIAVTRPGRSAPPGTTMIRFNKPSPSTLDEFLAAQARLDFTDTGVGTTAAPPAGYTVDRTRVRLGGGEAVFWAATSALGRWDQFRLGWVEAYPADATIRPAIVVVEVDRVLGARWANACRVSEALYLCDPDDNVVDPSGDRPQTEWPRTPTGELAMFTRRLDLEVQTAEEAPKFGDRPRNL